MATDTEDKPVPGLTGIEGGKAAANGNGNGGTGDKSIEQLAKDAAFDPDEPEVEVEEEDDGQLAIAGTVQKLDLKVGGAKPKVSIAKIKALKLPVRNVGAENPSQFEKGDVIRAVVELQCVDLQFPDTIRKGVIESTQRVHIFTPLSIEIVD